MYIAALLILLSTPVPKIEAEVDNDGDGWTVSQGDCCDVASGSCTQPALVNPGAFEIPANSIDDDCNGFVDEARAACDAVLASNASDPFMYAQAIDACQTTIENPLIEQRRWGVINTQLLLPDGTGSPAASSRSIRASFGANSTQFGGRFAVLSTGTAAAPGQTNPGHMAFQGGQVMGTLSAFPGDWFSANGNRLPAAPGCPDPTGSAAQDPIMLKLRIRVPTNARSFSVSTRFFTAEYPEYVCSPYNDFYVVLLDSSFAGSPANPNDRNLAIYALIGGDTVPIGVNLAFGNTGLFQACKNGPTGCAPLATAGTTATCTGTTDLTGTGFDQVNPPPAFVGVPGYCGQSDLSGGGTAWLTTRGNVAPGETIELRFALWDTSDGYYDSLVLIDNFEWSTDPTTPGTFVVGQVPPTRAAPPAPVGVAATAQTSASVLVSWNVASSATSYQIFRRGPGGSFARIGAAGGTSFTDVIAAANTSYLYRVRALNELVASTDSASDMATTVIFADDPLANGTLVKAIHLSQLRSAIIAVRNLAGLSATSFTDAASSGIAVKSVHVTEIRAALDAALTSLGFSAGGYADPTLTGTVIKSVHFEEIRNRIR